MKKDKKDTITRRFLTDIILSLWSRPASETWEQLEIIAYQNDLNLMMQNDFEEAKNILYKSVILN